MRYYWEVLFSTEYFPYWEFTMLMMLLMLCSVLWRLHRTEGKIDIVNETLNNVLDDLE
tara:strand:- start:94 stop:267 length:174 start_codon:yes stop_codon:yes gene_type:complete